MYRLILPILLIAPGGPAPAQTMAIDGAGRDAFERSLREMTETLSDADRNIFREGLPDLIVTRHPLTAGADGAALMLTLPAAMQAAHVTPDGVTRAEIMARGREIVTGRGRRAQAQCAQWNTREFFASATGPDIRRCLARGAAIDARHRESGRTPLHRAALAGTAETVRVLLEAGADAASCDERDRTPRDEALDNGTLKGTSVYRHPETAHSAMLATAPERGRADTRGCAAPGLTRGEWRGLQMAIRKFHNYSGDRSDRNMAVVVRVTMTLDGTISGKPVLVRARGGTQAARNALFQAGRRAVVRAENAGVFRRLRRTRYPYWRRIDVTFSIDRAGVAPLTGVK